jgi:hypothetical protein
MMEAVPKSWFSWNFDVIEDSSFIADLDISTWRERGKLKIGDDSYLVYRKSILSRTIILEYNDEVIAKATKSGVFRSSYSLEIGDKNYLIKNKSLFGRATVL